MIVDNTVIKPLNEFKLRNLVKDVSAFSIQPIFEKSIGILLIPLYTAYLAVTDYGVLSYYDAVATVFITLTSFGLGPAFWKFIADPNTNDSQVYNCMVYTQQLGAIVGIILIMTLQYLNVIKHGYLLVVYLLFESTQRSYGSFASNLRIQHKALKYVTISSAITLIRILTTIVTVVYMSSTYTSVIYSRVFVFMLTSTIGYYYLISNHGINVNIRLTLKMLKYGIPLSISSIIGIVLTTSDKFIVQAFRGDEMLGIYAYAENYALILKAMIITPFILAWIPNMWEIYNSGKGDIIFPKIAKIFTGGLLCMYDAIVLGMTILATVLTKNNNYMSGMHLFPILALGYAYYGMYLYEDKGYYFTSNTRYIMSNMAMSAVLNIALNVILLPRLGLIGVAIATMVTYMALKYVSYAIVSKMYNYKRCIKEELILQGYSVIATVVYSLLLYRGCYSIVIGLAGVNIAVKITIMFVMKYIKIRHNRLVLE